MLHIRQLLLILHDEAVKEVSDNNNWSAIGSVGCS